ncbi:MAG: hypothetical protein AB7L09_01440 [Nitrospira sp.]
MRRSGGRNSNSGRRGRKYRKQEAREERKRDDRAQAARAEADECKKLREYVEPIIRKLCELSADGIVVPLQTQMVGGGRYTRDNYVLTLSADGRVAHAVWGIDGVTVKSVQPWHELGSIVLTTIKSYQWKPVRPKNILDRLIDAVG